MATIVAKICGGPPDAFVILCTNYFGGMGDQAGLVVRQGRTLETDGTINAALEAIGVTAGDAHDAFDAVGLGDHRAIPWDLLDRWREYTA